MDANLYYFLHFEFSFWIISRKVPNKNILKEQKSLLSKIMINVMVLAFSLIIKDFLSI